MLSRDEKILYVTNRRNIVAFDVQPDGTIQNPKTIATLEAGGNGDGICIDSEGRLYVTSGNSGIQVFMYRRKVSRRHSSSTVCLELRVLRTEQEGALREGRRSTKSR
jgi:sugar lactone lactonase YvrE